MLEELPISQRWDDRTATGGEFLSWKADKPRKVLYLDGEMAAAALQERLQGIVLADDRDFDPEYLRLVTPDLQPGAMPDLATVEGQGVIEAILGDAELIIVDNISTLVRNVGRENDAESWNAAGTWALRMRQKGRSVLFLHHSGKGGAQRGSSKKEDTLDAVICLKHPADYSPEQGARFGRRLGHYYPGSRPGKIRRTGRCARLDAYVLGHRHLRNRSHFRLGPI